MASQSPQPHLQFPILNPRPYLHLAVHYEPRPDCPNWVNVLCEYTDDGKAIAAYLSPLEAMIDAACFSRPGRIYHAVCAHEFDPSIFIRDHHNTLVFALHLAWAAHDGKLIKHPNGAFGACSPTQAMAIAPEGASHIDFPVDPGMLATYEHLREHAGLFAYREAFKHVVDMNERQRHQAVAQALQKVPGTLDADVECDQLAIYDPEFAQWHFVPRSLLDETDN